MPSKPGVGSGNSTSGGLKLGSLSSTGDAGDNSPSSIGRRVLMDDIDTDGKV